MFKFSSINNSRKQIFQAIIMIGLLSFLMLSPQLYKHALIVSNDFLFHMNRFYDLSQQLKTGHFNYFQSLYGFAQSGRIVNAMYGMDFAFIQAIILAIFGTWFKFQLVSSFLCFFVSGISMYSLTRYAKVDHSYSLVAAIFYMSTSTIAYYALVTNFSGWGAAFLPLAFLPVVYMFQNKERPIKPLLLGIPIALLLSVHLFSTVLAVLALIPFYIYTFFTCRNKLVMIKDTLLAIFVAVLLSANTFGAIYDLSGDDLISPYAVKDMMANSTSFSIGVPGWATLGLIFSFLFIFQAVSTGVFWKQLSHFERLLNSVGIFFLFLSSKFVPWNSIAARFTFIQSMQFPQRFVCVACILLLLGWAIRMQKMSENPSINNQSVQRIAMIFFATLALISCNNINLQISSSSDAWSSDQPIKDKAATIIESDPEKIRQAFGGNNPLGTAFKAVDKSTADYLPRYTDEQFKTYGTYAEEILQNEVNVTKKITSDNRIELTWENKLPNDTTLLPVTIYNRTSVELNGKKLSKERYEVSNIGSLIIKAPKGENTVVVGYDPSIIFKISIVIKVLSLLVLLTYGVKAFMKYSFKNKK
ncbi:hypothetical protein JZO66_09355 [Enterococcus sp. DIV0242_7C1]|uniref:Membrane protein 6-pyruvoyl-tetrahydropterin synthase-related domain-containing protein n=1 Tax=Candidatus Enterococcus dunnyi TaxID=1834192 RepID=A0A200J8N7_9ENTE|nr:MULTISPECIES: hypothetical protein [unclassified Enterococcus]MBO0470753.1 hypothetical protein [Enterococcus sp. DIV0242_7C1]OUZ33201.1 hypothetical protein A5889_001911 [Enterococcus sp. 9D6_DIV0238]